MEVFNMISNKISKVIASAVACLVGIGILSYGTFKLTSFYLDRKVEKQSQFVNSEINPSIPEYDIDSSKEITAEVDTLHTEEAGGKTDFRNGEGYYLVDTDGDLVGDEYWSISKADLDSQKYGLIYVYSKDGVKPNFLLPAQFYKTENGYTLGSEYL